MKALTVILILAVLPLPASAQTVVVPVVEVGANLFQNTVTAAQSVISAVNSVTNLIPLDAIVVAGDIGSDMQTLGAIMTDAQGLMQDVRTLQQLFDPHSVPTTLPAMHARIRAMNEAILTSQQYALKAQTLVATLVSTVRHLTNLINEVGALVGNKAGQQALIQVDTTMSKTLTVLTTQTASSQRMDTLVQMRTEVIRAMDAEITRQYYAPWFEVAR